MKKLKLSLFFAIFFITILIIFPSYAGTEYTNLNNHWFYIKNAYTGQYLDLDNGFAEPDTNVQQCKYNGSYAQKWFIYHKGNGIYMIYSDAGSYTENGTLYVQFALDVYNGWGDNGTNIQIYYGSTDNYAQEFTFKRTDDSTYIIRTKASNYQKVMSLSNYSCNDGVNIHQWEYSNDSHDQWILEPVYSNYKLGVEYAKANYNKRLDAFPDVSNLGGDCTNFVSQCLLSGGLHQNSEWFCTRKNLTYHDISSTSQLDYSWDFADPSPWISATEFKNYFYNNRCIAYFTGQYILDNPDKIYKLNIGAGDVIQYATNALGNLSNGRHTMYVRGTTIGNVRDVPYNTYELTYHSRDVEAKDLLAIAEDHKLDYFVFYDFTK